MIPNSQLQTIKSADTTCDKKVLMLIGSVSAICVSEQIKDKRACDTAARFFISHNVS